MKQQAPASAIEVGFPLWGRSIAWLLFLGPFFFLSYGFSNHLAAEKAVTDAVFFDWERNIPFLPWTILPYWSIDLLYGLSFLLCRSRMQVDRHALRLLTAQLVSVSFFLAFPLHYAFERPHVDGLFGAMFDALMGFDQPYNQAPSLHISLLVILWVRFASSVSAPWRMLVHLWAVLIGLSVMTTFQHHFIDIPTGILVGLLCLWLWPDRGQSPLAGGDFVPTSRHFRVAAYYLLGAFVLAGLAQGIGGAALWLWWGAAALGLVELIYARSGAAGFQKQDGRHSLSVAILLAPYVLGAWLNSRWWTRRHLATDNILDDVWLGRLPSAGEMRSGGFSTLCDFTAELPAPRGDWRYTGLAWLDMVPPDVSQLIEAARLIESSRIHGPVLVCCALGYSRSACAVLAWLLLTGRVQNLDAAEAMLREKRPQVVLSPAHRAALAELTHVARAGALHA
ncbi:MAG: phosphatase PAP2/dual specificity phosphatase family protein [Gammaproteobacteria bacterium]|nr:phosphatase PAP2/dual specificity phosphatase family protein [Gammaproteobacteria bacterium]